MLTRILLLVLLVAPMAGCYVVQSAAGQLDVNARRVPIRRLLADPDTSPALAGRLRTALAARDYASRELGLPDNGSYRAYADVHRVYVVWNVFAATEFSVEPKTWCFPVAGCVAYRGYFSEARARRYALGLEAKGFDVTVGGVPAYSTLGHFDDPVLNTMLHWDDLELAAQIFHELAHQMLYVKGDTMFNESFATVVEEEGARRWLEHENRSGDLARHELAARRYAELSALVAATRAHLRALYATSLPEPAKRAGKQAELERLREEYQARRDQLGHGYDALFGASLNNATLLTVATYQGCVDGLRALLVAGGSELPAFYAEARRLAALRPRERHDAVCRSPGPTP